MSCTKALMNDGIRESFPPPLSLIAPLSGQFNDRRFLCHHKCQEYRLPKCLCIFPAHIIRIVHLVSRRENVVSLSGQISPLFFHRSADRYVRSNPHSYQHPPHDPRIVRFPSHWTPWSTSPLSWTLKLPDISQYHYREKIPGNRIQ